MAKTTIKVKCDTVSANANASTVRFTEGETVAAPAQPGQPAQRLAKSVFNFSFQDNKAGLKYEIGKDYTITIEG